MALSNHQSKGGSLTQDSNHLVIDQLQKTHNLSNKEAHDWFHAPKIPEQTRARDQITSNLISQATSGAIGGSSMETGVQKFKTDYNNKDMSQEYVEGQQAINDQHDKNSRAVTERANNQELNRENIAKQVNEQEEKLQTTNYAQQEQADEDKSKAHLNKQYQEKQYYSGGKFLQDKEPIIMPSHRRTYGTMADIEASVKKASENKPVEIATRFSNTKDKK